MSLYIGNLQPFALSVVPLVEEFLMVEVPKASGDLLPPPLEPQLFGFVVWWHGLHVDFVCLSRFRRSPLWGWLVEGNRSQTNVCVRAMDGIVD